MTIQQAAFTPIQAANYIGIDTDTDALKSSRSTGILWGITAPLYKKAGVKKVIYLKADLDSFLTELPSYRSTAQT